MRRQALWATTAFICGLGLAATAAAQGPGAGGPGAGPGGYMLQKFDTNNDGKVSEDEFRTVHQQMFDAMDTNRDGVVTTDEVAAYASAQRANRKIARMDADGDGKVTRDEFQQYSNARFTKADTNQDKALTGDELSRRPGGKGAAGKGSGSGPGGSGSPQQQ